MAADWRHRFHKDVVVDLVGYRRRASHHVTSFLFVLLVHVSGSTHMPCHAKACHRLAPRAHCLGQARQCPASCNRAKLNICARLLRGHALLGRHGHNEQDSPNAGFPLTYARVAAHPRVLSLYSERLVREGALQPAQLSAWHADVETEFQREYAAAEAGEYAESVEAWLATSWQGDALHVRMPLQGAPPGKTCLATCLWGARHAGSPKQC